MTENVNKFSLCLNTQSFPSLEGILLTVQELTDQSGHVQWKLEGLHHQNSFFQKPWHLLYLLLVHQQMQHIISCIYCLFTNATHNEYFHDSTIWKQCDHFFNYVWTMYLVGGSIMCLEWIVNSHHSASAEMTFHHSSNFTLSPHGWKTLASCWRGEWALHIPDRYMWCPHIYIVMLLDVKELALVAIHMAKCTTHEIRLWGHETVRLALKPWDGKTGRVGRCCINPPQCIKCPLSVFMCIRF